MHWERSVATIANVARKAGVSAATADHVSNGTRRVAAHPEEPAIESFGDRFDITTHSPKAASTTSATKAIRKRGLPAPKDLSVVGFNERYSRGRPQ
jgi:DNA-binding LacI/PurR family transcriptional regulator